MIPKTRNTEVFIWGYYFLRDNIEVSFVSNLIVTINNSKSGILQMNITM